MCNEHRRNVALSKVVDDWSHTRIKLRFPEGLPNLAPLDSIRITDSNVIDRLGGEDAGRSVGTGRFPTRPDIR